MHRAIMCRWPCWWSISTISRATTTTMVTRRATPAYAKSRPCFANAQAGPSIWWPDWGGEEFALLLPHQDSSDAVQVAERCLRVIEAAAIAHAGSPVAPHVTVSVGVAQSMDGEQDGAAILAAADAALYRAKRQGRRRVVAATASTG